MTFQMNSCHSPPRLSPPGPCSELGWRQQLTIVSSIVLAGHVAGESSKQTNCEESIPYSPDTTLKQHWKRNIRNSPVLDDAWVERWRKGGQYSSALSPLLSYCSCRWCRRSARFCELTFFPVLRAAQCHWHTVSVGAQLPGWRAAEGRHI